MVTAILKKTSITALAVIFVLACPSGESSAAKEIPIAGADTEISTHSLHGAYRNAGADTPLILIVPGSGPISRDGNMPGMAGDIYKHLAGQLAAVGISTVRVDKRGMYSSHAAGDPNRVTLDIYGDDYRLWVDHLIAETGKDCIYLLGHSEGALMVSAAAADRTDICGLILAAGPGQCMGDLLREQIKANPANKPIKKKAFEAISQLEAGQSVDVSKMHPALQGLFAPAVQDYLKSVLPVDPVETLGKTGLPALIIQGDNDLQVSLKDAKQLGAVPNAKLVILKDVNHVLKRASKSRTRNLAAYNMPDRPIDGGVITAITDFVNSP